MPVRCRGNPRGGRRLGEARQALRQVPLTLTPALPTLRGMNWLLFGNNPKRELKGQYANSISEHLASTVGDPFADGEHEQVVAKAIDDRGNGLLVVKKLSEAEVVE